MRFTNSVHSLLRPLALAASIGIASASSAAQPSDPLIQNLGGGYSPSGAAPEAGAHGAMYPGTTARFDVRGAEPGGPAYLVIGWSLASAPAAQPAIAPTNDFIIPVTTDGSGVASFSITIPENVAFGTTFYSQWLTAHPVSFEYSYSNVTQCSLHPAPLDGVGLYDAVALEAMDLVQQDLGFIDLLDFILDHPAELSADPALLLELITPTEVGPAVLFATLSGPISSGSGGSNITTGKKTPLKNIIGKVGDIWLEASRTQNPQGDWEIDKVAAKASWLFLYKDVVDMGGTYFKDCPAPSPAHTQCRNYFINYGQRIVLFGATLTISSYDTETEEICAQCD